MLKIRCLNGQDLFYNFPDLQAFVVEHEWNVISIRNINHYKPNTYVNPARGGVSPIPH